MRQTALRPSARFVGGSGSRTRPYCAKCVVAINLNKQSGGWGVLHLKTRLKTSDCQDRAYTTVENNKPKETKSRLEYIALEGTAGIPDCRD